jgi:hypothetical protein
MKQSTLALAVATAFAFAASSSLAAQGKGQGGGPKPKTNSSAQAPKAQGQGSVKVKTTGSTKVQGASAKVQGSSAKAQGPKAKTQAPKATGQSAKVTGQGKVKSQASTDSSVAGRVSTDATVTDPDRTSKKSSQDSTTLTPVQAKLEKNTNLATKLQSRLPAGTDLMLAAADFRNLGQFVAAVNVSNNLGIPFADLKTRMVDDGMSLGQAIKAERSDVDAIVIARQAETDATVLINQTTTTSTSKKPKK